MCIHSVSKCEGRQHAYTLVIFIVLRSLCRSAEMRPYIFHLVFLSVFGFLNMHVQVRASGDIKQATLDMYFVLIFDMWSDLVMHTYLSPSLLPSSLLIPFFLPLAFSTSTLIFLDPIFWPPFLLPPVPNVIHFSVSFSCRSWLVSSRLPRQLSTGHRLSACSALWPASRLQASYNQTFILYPIWLWGSYGYCAVLRERECVCWPAKPLYFTS